MVARFVEVPAEAIFAFLEGRGFVRGVVDAEVVYDRPHYDPRIIVRVYTTIRAGDSYAREVGDDAIRVAVFYDDGREKRGIAGPRAKVRKIARVHRTGSVEAILERLLERMREGWRFANEEANRLRRAGWWDSRSNA